MSTFFSAGDAGGVFGLMLGASLLTFFEFVDLIIFLLYHQVLRLNKNREEESKKDTEKMGNGAAPNGIEMNSTKKGKKKSKKKEKGKKGGEEELSTLF